MTAAEATEAEAAAASGEGAVTGAEAAGERNEKRPRDAGQENE